MAIPSWLNISQLSGSGDTIITITASTLEGLVERTTNLVVSGHTKSVTVPVTQVPHDYAEDYLTFRITSDGLVRWTRDKVGDFAGSPKSIQYRVNGGEWSTITSTISTASTGTIINAYAGDVFEFKGDNETYSSTYTHQGTLYHINAGSFKKTTAGFTVEGNVMSLIDSENFRTLDYVSGDHALDGLFGGLSLDGPYCTGLTSAKNLCLPATALLTSHTYAYMFGGCTALTEAPSISATSLSENCYYGMFDGCTSLVTPPELIATTLQPYCYYAMFARCSSLTTVPTLPAAAAATYCYGYMFEHCTALTQAPVLPATTLDTNCYLGMFYGCTSLTTAPALPAQNLANSCYRNMFEGCTALTTPPTLSSTTLAQSCYAEMFLGCTSLTTAPTLPAQTVPTGGYTRMFSGCTSLTAITCLATTLADSTSTSNWVRNVPQVSTGVFTKNQSMSGWARGNSGIPNNWTVVDAT